MSTPQNTNPPHSQLLGGMMTDIEGFIRWVLSIVQIAVGVCLGIFLFLWVAANYVHTQIDQIHPTYPTFPTTTTTTAP